jgi:uncharacterized protein YpbB
MTLILGFYSYSPLPLGFGDGKVIQQIKKVWPNAMFEINCNCRLKNVLVSIYLSMEQKKCK